MALLAAAAFRASLWLRGYSYSNSYWYGYLAGSAWGAVFLLCCHWNWNIYWLLKLFYVFGTCSLRVRFVFVWGMVRIVLQGSWIYRVLPCMLFCSYSYFCLAFWCCIRLCALRQNSVRDTLGSLIYLRLFDKMLRLLLLWCSYFNKLLRIHWFVGLGAS